MKRAYQRFFASESSSGWLLLVCIIVSLGIANSPLSGWFVHVLSIEVGGTIGHVELDYSIQSWINDGLMVLFFLLVGLEVKRSFLIGELSSFKKASLPVFAAIGGCIVPAVLFALINANTHTANGWAIPMATDIAFALAMLKVVIGKKGGAAKNFLSTLAIADDICAIIVIALFYSSGIDSIYLLAAAGVFAIQIILNKAGVSSLWVYLVSGLVLWYFIHHSGIHATIAGVLTAFTIPLSGKNKSAPLEKLEHLLLQPVNFVIVPLFVLANTNITFRSGMTSGLFSPLSLGIFAGLVLGKPMGVMLFSYLTVRFRISSLPMGMKGKHLLGLGILAGIGFTMSIFVAILSYEQEQLLAQAKFTILLSSVVAGGLGYIYFKQLDKTESPVNRKG